MPAAQAPKSIMPINAQALQPQCPMSRQLHMWEFTRYEPPLLWREHKKTQRIRNRVHFIQLPKVPYPAYAFQYLDSNIMHVSKTSEAQSMYHSGLWGRIA